MGRREEHGGAAIVLVVVSGKWWGMGVLFMGISIRDDEEVGLCWNELALLNI